MEKLPLREYLTQPEYDLSHLPGLVLVSYSGSMAFGMNHPDSDVDLKGIYMGKREDLLCQTDEKTWVSKTVDVSMYTLHYAFGMLAKCNPILLETLFTLPEDRVCFGRMGEMLIEHRKEFLSQRALDSFLGYTTSQLHKLENALARDQMNQPRQEEHLRMLLERMAKKFTGRYQGFLEDELRLYVDDSSKERFEKEIFIDLNLRHYPIRDLKASIADFNDCLAQFDGGNPGNRNHKKDDKHLCKHAAHLVRLLMEGRDLLEHGEFCTYRTSDRDVLLELLYGKYLKPDGTWDMEGFGKMVDNYMEQVRKAGEHTKLPKEPDMDSLRKLEAMMTGWYLSGRASAEF